MTRSQGAAPDDNSMNAARVPGALRSRRRSAAVRDRVGHAGALFRAHARTRWYRAYLRALISVCLLSTCSVVGADEDDSLARLAPADSGIFVEVHNAQDLLTTLLEPQLWTALAGLAGQPANPSETRGWKQIIRQAVRMEPDEAIRVLLADGVAFVGPGLGRSQDGVVLARPRADTPPQALLKKWQARRIDGQARPPMYWLYRNVGVAVHEGTLIFGDLLPPEGMFRHVLSTLGRAQSPRLADDPVFAALRARLPAHPDGLCFVRLGPAVSNPAAVGRAGPSATSAPAVGRGGSAASAPAKVRARRRGPPGYTPSLTPLGDSHNIMLALVREKNLLHVTAVGDAPGGRSSGPVGAGIDVSKLPGDALLVWESDVDYAALAGQLRALPDGHVLRMAMSLLPPEASADRLFASLRPATALLIGLAHPPGRPADMPPVPSLGLVVGVEDGALVRKCMHELVRAATVVYDSLSLARGLPGLPEPTTVAISTAAVPVGRAATSTSAAQPVMAQVLDLTSAFPGLDQPVWGRLQFAWAVDGDVLVLASDEDWLRQILAARHAIASDLSSVVVLSELPIDPRDDNVIVVQTGLIGEAGQAWLKYLAAQDSPVLADSWWRDRQPGRGVRLGIDVEQNRSERRLRVRSVQAGRPAAGFLLPGDEIVGFNDHRFSTDEPIREMRKAIRERPEPGWLALLVERNGVIRSVRIPLPYVNPIRTLRRLVAMGQVARLVVYHDRLNDPAGPLGYLTIELKP